MLYILNNAVSIIEILLRFFAPYHGQNEGDSAHSAIGYSLKRSGEIFLPAQLVSIFRLSRRKNPYKVNSLLGSDFLNFKLLSQNLRILSVRQDDLINDFNWTKMVEFRVIRDQLTKLYFKTSHLEANYRSITLKRNVLDFLQGPVAALNKSPIKLSEKKYTDLMALCSGDKPPIKLPEYKQYYRSLPH